MPAPEPLTRARLFGRFLRFGVLAWGGPVTQIAMIREELVDREQWIPPPRFNRVLAVYQALPGPEAHELCVYFGTVARGRWGGILAGLGFMLPGFMLMLALSWAYVRWGLTTPPPALAGALAGCQAAVVALIVRAVQRIGAHALHDRALWAVAIGVAAATLAGVDFMLSLPLAGAAYAAVSRGLTPGLPAIIGPGLAGLVPSATTAALPTVVTLLGYGLRCGLLTFGGAYTAIPLLQHDAVVRGAWMTNAQFLDGVALAGILPAPLIIFSTFVGYMGGGFPGAFAMTAGVFAPAFLFTIIGHRYLERLVDHRGVHAFLDGVTAGVVGLIAVTALQLLRGAVTGVVPALVFGAALLLAWRWRARLAVLGIMGLAALAGWATTALRIA